MSRTKLQTLYNELSQRTSDPRRFRGELADVAFEILSADTFVGGLAATLLEGKHPDQSHRQVLTRPLLAGLSWLLDDGRRIDLSTAPELHAHAKLVEQLRVECVRCLGN